MLKSEFYFDTDFLSRQEQTALSGALQGIVQGDAPFLFELFCVDEEDIVLSFPSMEEIKGETLCCEEHGDELDEEGRLFLGSVIVCKKRAEEQAEEYGHSYLRELFYLAVHGILHCLGYDHEREEDKAEMRQKEEEILSRMRLARE